MEVNSIKGFIRARDKNHLLGFRVLLRPNALRRMTISIKVVDLVEYANNQPAIGVTYISQGSWVRTTPSISNTKSAPYALEGV